MSDLLKVYSIIRSLMMTVYNFGWSI